MRTLQEKQSISRVEGISSGEWATAEFARVAARDEMHVQMKTGQDHKVTEQNHRSMLKRCSVCLFHIN